MKFKHLLPSLLALIFISCQSAFSQKFFEMMEDPNANFFEVQKEANEYFKIHGTGRGTLYKQFKRWESDMQYYIDEQGNRIAPSLIYERAKAFEEQSKLLNENKKTRANTWVDMGPWDWKKTTGWNPGLGRIDGISVDPKNANNIFIISPEGGCWKTTDGGGTWTSLTDGLTYMKLGSVAVDPSNSNTVYIGTLAAGLLKSTTGGTNLTQINTGISSNTSVKRIAIDPTNSNHVVLATSTGLYKTTDGGNNWTKSTITPTATPSTTDIKFKPGDPNTVYACGNDFYKSTDGGSTYTKISSGIIRSGTMRIAVTPANPDLVCIVQCNGSVFGAFYKSTDSGTNFAVTVQDKPNYFGYSATGSDNSGQGAYNIAICISPTDANEIHIAGIITWKSTDGGTSFVSTTEWRYPNSRGYTHCDMHALEYVGNTLYTGSDGGIFKSTDKGDNFTNISKGLGIRMFYRLGLSKTKPEMVAVGAQDNGCSLLKSTGWIDWLGADGMETAIDPANANLIYGSTQNGSFYKSTDAGITQSGLNMPASGVWTSPFAVDKNSVAYAGLDEVYKSTNAGSSWTKISSIGGGKCNYLEVSPTNPSYIYVAKGAGLHKTTNGGTGWTNISAGLGGATINRIAIHDSDPNKIAVAVGGNKVYTSTNGGTSWTDYSANLPAIGNRCILYENGPKEGLYLGTNTGVFYRDNTMSSWVAYDAGLPKVPVNELEIQYTVGKIRAATYGRGVWECDLYSATTDIETLSSNNIAIDVYPNPSKGQIELTLNSSVEDDYSLEITNTLGEIVHKETLDNCSGPYKQKFNLTKFGKGVYFITLNSSHGKISKKVVLN